MAKPQPSYTKEFKQRAVQLVETSKKSKKKSKTIITKYEGAKKDLAATEGPR